MRRIVFVLIILFAAIYSPAFAQGPAAENRFAAEIALAEKVVGAHGGDKLRGIRSLVLRGSVDITASNFPQAIPGGFSTVFQGDMYRFELQNQFQNLTQIYNGTTTSSTAPGGITLPPVNRIGLPMLASVGKTGFIVTSLAEDKKKRIGFRVTSPEGYFTDFYVDQKTNQLKGYDSTFTIDGRTITTNVEIDKLKAVDGLLIPDRYVQRFDLGSFTVYASFKTKEMLVNSELDPNVFSISEGK
jgi:hypothetical protein